MIRGRKEGSNYATWFIGFDHDETFGLPPFPELPPPSPQTPVLNKPVSRATSVEALVQTESSSESLKPIPRAQTPVGTQTSNDSLIQTSTQTSTDSPGHAPHQASTQTIPRVSESSTETSDLLVKRSRTPDLRDSRSGPQDINAIRSRKKRDKDTQGIYKEAFDGAKRAEEFKFRVKFDKLLGDLHLAIEEKNPDGLPTSFASPSYGEVMLTFRGKVKELLKGYSQRLQLAYESFGSVDSSDNTGQKVKQDVSKFIEDLIGETLDLTSDEAVSDLSSLSDDSSPDQNSFEDLLAQAVVSKLLENHRKEVSDTLNSTNKPDNTHNHKDQATETNGEAIHRSQPHYDELDGHRQQNSKSREEFINGNYRNITGWQNQSRKALSNPDLFNYKSDLIPDDENNDSDNSIDEPQTERSTKNYDESIEVNRLSGSEEFDENLNSDAVGETNDSVDIEKEFAELKAFVQKTQTQTRPKVEAKVFDDSSLCEVKEEQLSKITVDRDEEREEFHTRYSVFDRVHNSEPPLPDFSQFENIDFTSSEIDPDLLSMNLAIIPEETEEELELEEDDEEQSKWRSNWIFKGKGVSPYENMGKKKVNLDSEGPLYMMVPRPEQDYIPQIGSRDVDQLSDFSNDDLLSRSDLDGSDDDENTFYANTSKELARISGQRRQHRHSKSSGNQSEDSDFDDRSARRKPLGIYDRNALDYPDAVDEVKEHVSGPIVEPSKQELKLLQDLVPSENDDPKFLVPPESVTIQEGEPVKFSCRVGGTPPIDVFWYREGDEVEELEDSEDVEISANGDRYNITMYNINKKLGGQYMCIALSEKGKAIQYLVVTVKDNKQDLKKPEFLKGLKDVEVTEGQSVKLRVKVKGYPPPRISWYKDGNILRSSKSCRIEKFGNRDYILTIDYASMNDDAEYTVSARNVAGEEKMTAQVIVEPQSELPVRRQRISSVTTSGASDSDSDRTSSRRNIANVGLTSASSTASHQSPSLSSPVPQAAPEKLSPSPSSSKAAMRQREDQLHLKHLDRKVSLTQKRVEEEAEKMIEDAEKDESTENKKLLSSNALDILHTAEEIIQHENKASKDSSSSHNGANTTNTDARTSSSDDILGGLSLPDTLDDFPLPSGPALTKSTLDFSLPNKTPANTMGNDSQPVREETNFDDLFSSREKSKPEKFTSEVSFPKRSTNSVEKTNSSVSPRSSTPDQNNSSTSGNGKSLSDISRASSVALNTKSRDIQQPESSDSPSQQAGTLKGQYSRDFELPQKEKEKKKWSVTLDPFSPSAEIVNKPKSEEKITDIEINVVDLSPSSSLRSSKGDNSSQSSSPRQSVDSGVFVNSKRERPAPVHMIGHTMEDDVPESRTEFNTDGSIELPSVNRLRAMFSNSKDDDLGDGSFKRIHSITARSVSKDQLEKLRASNQNPSSGSSSSLLEVPGSIPPQQSSSASLQLNTQSSTNSPSSSSTSKVTLRPLSATPNINNAPQHQKEQVNLSGNSYTELYPDKEPVLIYPETDPDYLKRHHLQQNEHQPQAAHQPAPVPSTKSNRAPLPPQQQRPLTPSPASKQRTTATSTPSKPPRANQQKLIVRRAVPEEEGAGSKKSGPRIKTGCISARAAFWERKMEGDVVDDEEFPEMVEDGDN